MEIGVSSFAETTPDPRTGAAPSHGQRLREVVEEAVLAEQVGLDVYGLGEHHRADYASSAPAVVLAAVAARTRRIRLTSAVTVLSSDDPVRVYQQFATLDLLSGGRAEVLAGRGSFIESFPLFGYDLADYDELFAEKLDLLLALREPGPTTWRGRHRPPLERAEVFPRAQQEPLPVWVGVGGNPSSVVRAGTLGLPLALAIIGGMPERFAPLADLFRESARRAGHPAGHPGQPEGAGALPVATHSHGFVAETAQAAADAFYGPYKVVMDGLGRERGWAPFSRAQFDAGRGPRGALYVGSPAQVAEKVLLAREVLGVDRFMLHVSPGTMPHRDVLRAIELLGTQVAPQVRAAAAAA